MNRETAARLVRKLRALAADRAAQPGEKATATRKADELVAKYGLGAAEVRSEPRPARRWAAPARGPVIRWQWNPVTGRGTPNVKVHYHRDRSNWKIEIPVEDVDLPPLPRNQPPNRRRNE